MPAVPRDVIASQSESAGGRPVSVAAVVACRAGHRFCRRYRLQTAAQYTEAFAARRVLRGAFFCLHYRRNSLSAARLGLVIPKKQARRAVLRNAVKRQIREIFRGRRPVLPAVDVIVRLAQPIDRVVPGTPRRMAGAKDKSARQAWRDEIAGLFALLCEKVRA